MGLFDKHIAPIILYGSSTCIIQSSHNLIYLDYLPEFRNTRTTDRQTLHDTCGYDITFTSARRAGMAGSNGTRRILISLINIQDKESVLSNTGKYDLQIMHIKCNPLLINSTTIFVSSLLMSANMNVTLQYWANKTNVKGAAIMCQKRFRICFLWRVTGERSHISQQIKDCIVCFALKWVDKHQLLSNTLRRSTLYSVAIMRSHSYSKRAIARGNCIWYHCPLNPWTTGSLFSERSLFSNVGHHKCNI